MGSQRFPLKGNPPGGCKASFAYLKKCTVQYIIGILFVTPFSKLFYIFYVLCGLSDMVDGYIARKTGTESDFGAKLDSIADTVFVAVCLIKLLPNISFEWWLWVWIMVIALIKVINIICGYFYQRQLIMLHTIANKITGFLLFMLPLFIDYIEIYYAAVPVCTVATFAAIQEGHFIRTGRIPGCILKESNNSRG